MKALLVVDVQNDFLPGGALAVPEGDQVIPIINKLMETFDWIIATQDWHPAGHGSFASAHPGKNPGDVVDLNGLQQILWPDHCIQDSSGAAFSDTLNTSTITGTESRGVCLYVGAAMTSITVTMESGNSATFKGVTAGSFLPILVTAVTAATGAAALADNDILALY